MSLSSLLRMRRGLAAAAAASATAAAAAAAAATLCDPSFVQDLPASVEAQRFRPVAPYGAWDRNWDHCEPTAKEVASALKHDWPITDYPKVIRLLYSQHAPKKSEADVSRLIAEAELEGGDALESLYKRAFLMHAYGGGTTRHIILVRHGQYEEHRDFERPLARDRDYGMPHDLVYPTVDAKQVLTPLGRRQAVATGKRLSELLSPALTTPGREAHVRIHVSSLARARETADLIAAHLPAHVHRYPPDRNLAEGWPLAHRIPYPKGAPEDESRLVHVEGARIEAAYRSLFYRGRLPAAAALSAGSSDGDSAAEGIEESAPSPLPRHEYDIVVCHGNVIRYFALRALQLVCCAREAPRRESTTPRAHPRPERTHILSTPMPRAHPRPEPTLSPRAHALSPCAHTHATLTPTPRERASTPMELACRWRIAKLIPR